MDSKAMYKEIAGMVNNATSSGHIAESKDAGDGPEVDAKEDNDDDTGDTFDNSASMITKPAPINSKKFKVRRLSKQLSDHLVVPDNELNFKIGDIVKAMPPDETMKFEGVCVAIDEKNEFMLIDFGDGAEPSEVLVSTVQRIQNGEWCVRGGGVRGGGGGGGGAKEGRCNLCVVFFFCLLI